MPGLRPTAIELNEIYDIGQRVFYSRSASIHEVADDYDLETLSATTEMILDHLLAEVSDLPDSAYERQPDDVDGSDVWSAGEILSHLVEVEFATVPFWESACAAQSDGPYPELLALLDRSPASVKQGERAVIDLRLRMLEMLDLITSKCTGSEQALHFMLGPSTVRAVILGNCLHIMDHVVQLRALRGPQG